MSATRGKDSEKKKEIICSAEGALLPPFDAKEFKLNGKYHVNDLIIPLWQKIGDGLVGQLFQQLKGQTLEFVLYVVDLKSGKRHCLSVPIKIQGPIKIVPFSKNQFAVITQNDVFHYTLTNDLNNTLMKKNPLKKPFKLSNFVSGYEEKDNCFLMMGSWDGHCYQLFSVDLQKSDGMKQIIEKNVDQDCFALNNNQWMLVSRHSRKEEDNHVKNYEVFEMDFKRNKPVMLFQGEIREKNEFYVEVPPAGNLLVYHHKTGTLCVNRFVKNGKGEVERVEKMREINLVPSGLSARKVFVISPDESFGLFEKNRTLWAFDLLEGNTVDLGIDFQDISFYRNLLFLDAHSFMVTSFKNESVRYQVSFVDLQKVREFLRSKIINMPSEIADLVLSYGLFGVSDRSRNNWDAGDSKQPSVSSRSTQ